MATPIQVTIDCAEPERLARFWAEALGYRLEEPPDGFATWRDYAPGRRRGDPPPGAGGEAIDHYAVVMADPEGNEFCLH